MWVWQQPLKAYSYWNCMNECFSATLALRILNSSETHSYVHSNNRRWRGFYLLTSIWNSGYFYLTGSKSAASLCLLASCLPHHCSSGVVTLKHFNGCDWWCVSMCDRGRQRRFCFSFTEWKFSVSVVCYLALISRYTTCLCLCVCTCTVHVYLHTKLASIS